VNILDAMENKSEIPKQTLDVRAELQALETVSALEFYTTWLIAVDSNLL